ncbi:MAG TPA: hypothetical protein PKD37_06600 [Oligoflexia bacterium]|nr:hypothetical protein [Oligoflexia bacterium]HMP27631.1 hypothetical protein [Oligoflexia bacterium]
MLFTGLIDVVSKRWQAQDLAKHPRQISGNRNEPIKKAQSQSINASNFLLGKDQPIKLPPALPSTASRETRFATVSRQKNISKVRLGGDPPKHPKQELIYKLRYSSLDELLGQLDALLERCMNGGFENFERSAYGKQFARRKIILSPSQQDKNLSALSKYLIKKFSSYQSPQSSYFGDVNMPLGVKKLWYLRELVAQKIKTDFNHLLITQPEPSNKANLQAREDISDSAIATTNKIVIKESFIKSSLKDYYGSYIKNIVEGALSTLNRCFKPLKTISDYLFNTSAVSYRC